MKRAISRRVFMAGCASSILAACSFGHAGLAPYGVVVRGEGNQLILQQVNEPAHDLLATVQSESGIGQALVTWWGNLAPHQVTFVLNLAGLEQFTLQWADFVVNLSVNASDGTTSCSLADAAGQEEMLTPASPYWIEVESLPVKGQGFILRAPRAFVAHWPPAWSIAWVDFFR